MPTLIDRINNHKLFNNLQILDGLINDIENKDKLDAQKIEAINRIDQICKHTLYVIDSTETFLIPITAMDNIKTHTDNCINLLKTFISNNDTNQLLQANNYMDNILIQLSYIQRPIISEDLKGIRTAVTAFKGSIGVYINNNEQQFNELTNQKIAIERELTSLKQTITFDKQRLDNAINQFQDQFSKAQEERIFKFNEKEQKRKDIFEQEEEEREEQHRQHAEKIKSEFSGMVTTLQREYESYKDNIATDSQNFNEWLETQRKHYDKTIDKYIKDIKELVKAITNVGLIDGYQKDANTQRNTAYFWETLTVLSMLGLICFSLWSIFLAGIEFSWANLAARVFVAGAIGTLAAYSGKKAAYHRKIERTNRKLQLELAAINPYLEDFDEDKQKEIKGELANRYFGNDILEQPCQDKGKKEEAEFKNKYNKVLELAIEFFQTRLSGKP